MPSSTSAKGDLARAAGEAVAATRAAHAFQQFGAGQGLEHGFESAAGNAQPFRHLRRAGERAAAAAPPGVEGDVEGHGDGGEGAVAAEQHGGGNLQGGALNYAAISY